MTLEKKIELAIWLCEHNPNVALTGSLMLYLRWKLDPNNKGKDFYLDREPQDLDFIVYIDEDDYDEYGFCLPPFIEKVEEKYSTLTGYDVLARFWIDGVKVEFIETPYFRYDEEFIGTSWFRPGEGSKGFMNDFRLFHAHHKNIRLAFISDLINAKETYVKEDKNLDYISKTKKDLIILKDYLNGIYKDDYFKILKTYINKSLYLKHNYEDKSRKMLEKIIYDYEVNNDTSKENWYKYISNLDHNWHNQYNHLESLKGNITCYSTTRNEEKLLEEIVYEYKIPFEVNKMDDLELPLL